jgi:hypothetical protein
MHKWSPANWVLKPGIASMQRTAYGLFVVASNGMHLFGSMLPPGLYCRPSSLKPRQLAGMGQLGQLWVSAGAFMAGSVAGLAAAPLPAAPGCVALAIVAGAFGSVLFDVPDALCIEGVVAAGPPITDV